MKKRLIAFGLLIMFICIYHSAFVLAAQDITSLTKNYQEYQRRFDGIGMKKQITEYGFEIITEHVFLLTVDGYGEVTVMPALDRRYHRLAIFIVQEDETIIYKTEQLEANNQMLGELKQPNKGIAAISFQDVNGDGLIDILLITFSEHKDGLKQGQTYKVCDVLFQQPLSKKQLFYRDYRISNKLNHYGMNKSIKFMTSYLVGDYSTEFLYTADTLDELLQAGFQISAEQKKWRSFEKWGKLLLVPGTYTMAEYTVFMLYLVNEQGYIVWSFQPMRDYESLYQLREIACQDIDGDGLKDIVVLGRYIFEETDNESVIVSDYSVFYQRSGGFYEDNDVKGQYPCSEADTLTEIINNLQIYWGWNT